MIDDAEVAAAWQEFIEKHIRPSRLLLLAQGIEQPTVAEVCHLASCRTCNEAYKVYEQP